VPARLEQLAAAFGALQHGDGGGDTQFLGQQVRQVVQRGGAVDGERVLVVGNRQAPLQRVEVGLPARGGRVQPAERPRVRQQCAFRTARVVAEELVREGRRTAEVLQNQQPADGIMREQLRAHPVLGRERGEQLVTRRLPHEAVAVLVERLQVALEHECSRQGERALSHPHPHHAGPRGATEVIRLRQPDPGAEPSAQHRFGRDHGRQYFGVRLATKCRWVGGGFHTHLLRPYSRSYHRP
jgi:hypothetical protein